MKRNHCIITVFAHSIGKGNCGVSFKILFHISKVPLFIEENTFKFPFELKISHLEIRSF